MTNIRQRKNSGMNLLNCCIVNRDKLHVQACYEYCWHESVDVARQLAGDVFLYAFRKHLSNAMSHKLLFAHTVVSFDHFVTSPVDKVVDRELLVILYVRHHGSLNVFLYAFRKT